MLHLESIYTVVAGQELHEKIIGQLVKKYGLFVKFILIELTGS
jgi:hypothetical protein